MEREGSCNIFMGSNENEVNRLAEKISKPSNVSDVEHLELMKRLELESTSKKLGITPEKLKAIRDYTVRLRKKFPHMKPDRLKRKVAEYFKVKLV
jgi:hypothetical protein